jgi:hypothetical protein
LRMKAMELAEAETASEKGHVLEDVALRKNGFYTRFCKKMKIPPSSADRLRKIYRGSLHGVHEWQAVSRNLCRN